MTLLLLLLGVYPVQVAGTEMGITEPEATFSACYGGAFLMWHPMKYAAMLAEKMQKHGTKGWLVNTGWTGGSYGVGSRISLKFTRAIIDAIHSGALDNVEYVEMPIFKLQVRCELLICCCSHYTPLAYFLGAEAGHSAVCWLPDHKLTRC